VNGALWQIKWLHNVNTTMGKWASIERQQLQVMAVW
jgi:hypothetical protein